MVCRFWFQSSWVSMVPVIASKHCEDACSIGNTGKPLRAATDFFITSAGKVSGIFFLLLSATCLALTYAFVMISSTCLSFGRGSSKNITSCAISSGKVAPGDARRISMLPFSFRTSRRFHKPCTSPAVPQNLCALKMNVKWSFNTSGVAAARTLYRFSAIYSASIGVLDIKINCFTWSMPSSLIPLNPRHTSHWLRPVCASSEVLLSAPLMACRASMILRWVVLASNVLISTSGVAVRT